MTNEEEETYFSAMLLNSAYTSLMNLDKASIL